MSPPDPGAGNSVTSGTDRVYERARVAAAMKGHLGDTKSVLIFRKGREGANAHLHSFEAHGELTNIHKKLLDDGVSDHLLFPHAGASPSTSSTSAIGRTRRSTELPLATANDSGPRLAASNSSHLSL